MQQNKIAMKNENLGVDYVFIIVIVVYIASAIAQVILRTGTGF